MSVFILQEKQLQRDLLQAQQQIRLKVILSCDSHVTALLFLTGGTAEIQ